MRIIFAAVVTLAAGLTLNAQRAPLPPLVIEEATIAQLHAEMRAKRLTCRALVAHYLQRIETYDKQGPGPSGVEGPALNAIVVTNPAALAEAEALDRRFVAGGPTGPLHCVPTVVKDNFETIGLQSADGSRALEGFVSDRDAFQVKKIKTAGAIVLAKTNMAEFAFSPLETLNSLQGHTKNPYALDRVPAGSSGGTAAAVASNFAAVGLGSDTGNSIRGPSSHTALVGIRSTMGLTSRAGVIPLSYLADIAGPMARTVEDAVTVFQVIVGEDPDDPVTTRSHGRPVPDYRKSLNRNGLKGARLGILRPAYERANADEEVIRVFMKAIDDLTRAGAIVVDTIVLEPMRRPQGAGTCRGFKYDINEYLTARGQRAPVHSLDEIIASGKFHPSVESRLQAAQRAMPEGPGSDACRAEAAYRDAFAAALTTAMNTARVDALIYPTWSNPPRPIGDLTSPAGDNSQVHSPTSGFPAVTVPMGYTREGQLPAGLTLLGRAWDEPTLIRLAYGYEQATRHRRPPASTPPLALTASARR